MVTDDKEAHPQSPAKDIRPTVALRSSDRSIWIFGGIAVAGAALLFYTLESRRSSSAVASITAPSISASDMISSPAPIDIPSAREMDGEASDWYARRPSNVRQEVLPAPRAYSGGQPTPPPFNPAANQSAQMPGQGSDTQRASEGASPVVIFNSAGKPAAPSSGTADSNSPERVSAAHFQNPSTTIPKGTVIQAVLETALDSTRAGFARAIVSRDVFGFDGTEILIPRGSRLVGDYKADLAAGQKRALIQWQRLMRPDGVTINLDSPAADPLGRAGVQGKVNSHFLDRFSGTILQSALTIGAQLATRSVSRDAVIVALPGSLPGLTAIQPEKVQPTLKVRHGTSVSVFVSRDLDFTTVTQ